jgi:uncharacterized protein
VVDRKCVACGKLQNRDEMIKITKDFSTGEVFLNKNSKQFGRSVYLCYNKTCVEEAFKKNKVQKALKSPIQKELKGILLDEF